MREQKGVSLLAHPPPMAHPESWCEGMVIPSGAGKGRASSSAVPCLLYFLCSHLEPLTRLSWHLFLVLFPGVTTTSLQDGHSIPFAFPFGIAWNASTPWLVVVFLS